MNRLLLFSWVVMAFLSSCEPEKTSATKTKVSCQMTLSNNHVVNGDVIHFGITSSDKMVKSTSYTIDNEAIDYQEQFTISDLSLGKHKLVGRIEFEDGTHCEKYMFLEVRSAEPPLDMSYHLIQSFPHDNMSYTQGLEYVDGIMYEGTGQYGFSKLRKYALMDQNIIQEIALEDNDFGEGVTLMGGHIYQLTWHKGMAYMYDENTWEKKNEFLYKGEGWGLSHDDKFLIMSNGTYEISFRDPETFQVDHKIFVYDDYSAVINLNELEYVDGYIYANVYQTNFIVKIDASTGQVVGRIDCTGILNPKDVISQIDVLNGIAYNPSTQHFYITGKYWPKLYEVTFEVKEKS